MFRPIQRFTVFAVLLAVAVLSGCATNRHLPSPVTAAPPKIDPVAVASDQDHGTRIAPVSFRTGVQERACAASS